MVCVVKTEGCTASGNEVWKAEGRLKKVRAIPETQTTRDITSAGEVRATGHPQQLFIANAQSFLISKPAASQIGTRGRQIGAPISHNQSSAPQIISTNSLRSPRQRLTIVVKSCSAAEFMCHLLKSDFSSTILFNPPKLSRRFNKQNPRGTGGSRYS
jgi:hypothetical protein